MFSLFFVSEKMTFELPPRIFFLHCRDGVVGPVQTDSQHITAARPLHTHCLNVCPTLQVASD